jgi:hypothetical protein
MVRGLVVASCERDDHPGETGEDGDEQCHLKGEGSCLGVDADDLFLNVFGLADEQFRELGVAHHFRVVFQRLRDLLLTAGLTTYRLTVRRPA